MYFELVLSSAGPPATFFFFFLLFQLPCLAQRQAHPTIHPYRV
jgi:hypothetical protein